MAEDKSKEPKPGSSALRTSQPSVPPKASKKYPFSRLVAEHGISRARVAALKVCTGWADETKITEPELEAAVNKHLKNKEA